MVNVMQRMRRNLRAGVAGACERARLWIQPGGERPVSPAMDPEPDPNGPTHGGHGGGAEPVPPPASQPVRSAAG